MNYLGLDYGDELSYCFFANDMDAIMNGLLR